ncbi:Histone-lysine N-methyltransferase, H3 lysine-9 specific [Psilocybe cubensis]|uniref:Histone-lysine N-methyltransferase, H3 lysine-9 specific n=1 Tax=Psilocybe cubensis TaxID=181762 RepID=A0ACB8H339_PSICU|nr:Histone-lysine N-methyltransferase, H3 lysine-9 specific [Psilocybe cubensis]KAH9482286.1 Histone-lysine N-methyltransferase, H3 lysine-9 specific [Psilocybe cubensis]
MQDEITEISNKKTRDEDDNSDSGGSLFSRSPSPVTEDGKERWRMSDPPQEIFDDGEWKFQIIGEEVDHNGQVVEWEDWYRKDGSNTTWETAETISDVQWKQARQKARHEMASKSLSMKVITTTDIHNTETHLRNDAYNEKMKKYSKQKEPNLFEQMEKLMAKHEALDRIAAQGSATVERSQAGSSKVSRSSSRLSSKSSATLLPGHAESFAKSRHPSVPSISHSYASSKPSSSMTILSSASPLSPPLPSKSIPSLKGKEKAVICHFSSPECPSSRESLPLDNHQPSSTFSSSSGEPTAYKRSKQSSPQHSDSESSQLLFSSSNRGRKRSRHLIMSGSEVEDADIREISPFIPPKVAPHKKNSAASSSSMDDSLHRRLELEKAWNIEAQRMGAAPIYFVNDIDDEPIPSVDPHFRYIEKSYEFAPGIEKPSDEFLLRCSCKKCTKAIYCDCQHPSFMLDEKNVPFFAYDKYGLFAFNINKGIEVIECNKLCKCAKSPGQCPNRVSQIPRKHPIEIFKTPTRGWGVRSTEAIKKGQVLGIYTGLVITREAANALPGPLAKYRFDLDGDELANEEEENPSTLGLYSVDSRLHGNWTRFINHSCSPNLQIYLVVHDTPPGIGLPYIAFVANQNIPIRKELTFDYNPGQSSTLEEGADPCHCGSNECRGFLFF